jgi:hypothetical protein
MKGYEHLAETIESYVANLLSEQERTAFETMMMQDAGLKEAVENEKTLFNLVLEQDLNTIKNKIKTDLYTSENKNIKYKSIGVAALLIASITATYFYATLKNTDTIQKERVEIIVPQKIDSTIQNEKDSAKSEKEKRYKSKPITQQTLLIDTNKPIQTNKIIPKIKDSTLTAKNELIVKQTEIEEVIKNEISIKKECVFEKIEAHLTSSPSQKGLSTGAIRIKLPNSISEKLVFSLNTNNTFVKDSHFSDLAKGEYLITAKDTKECEYQLGKSIVKETNCITEYQKTFSPDLENPWQIPVLINEDASIVIKNKMGENVYIYHGKIGNEIYWNGQSSSGNDASTGVYKIFVTHSNGEDCVYSVTLFR